MTIFVFSDSHGSTREMIALLESTTPDAVIHLGDGAKDVLDLESIFPHIPFHQVAGNCDMFSQLPAITTLEFQGVTLLLSHGHLWSVKSRMDIALAAGQDAHADILLYGHTHIPFCEETNGMWVMNPGPAPKSYGIIEITDTDVFCSLKAAVR